MNVLRLLYNEQPKSLIWRCALELVFVLFCFVLFVFGANVVPFALSNENQQAFSFPLSRSFLRVLLSLT